MKQLFLLAMLICPVAITTQAATPHLMSSGDYVETFDTIASWTDDFVSPTEATRWGSVAVNTNGVVPDGVRVMRASTNFTSTVVGGVQKDFTGGSRIALLSTGTTDNTNSVAIDLFLDFAGRAPGTLSFDWVSLTNSTGNRASSLRVYTTTNGTTFTELAGAAVLNLSNNVAASGSIANIVLPAAFSNCPTARIRFYEYNGSGGSTGSRAKIGIDNVAVTSFAPVLVVTSANNSGAGTLRQAVANALSGSIITFTNTLSGQTIPITSGIVLSKNLTIDASMLPGGITVNGSNLGRIFRIAGGTTNLLLNLTLTGGNGLGAVSSGSGGAIYNQGRLVMIGCTVSGNSAATGGGAIFSEDATSQLLMTNCTVAANTASFGAAMLIRNSNAVSLVHCTVAGNIGTGGTGGVVLESGATLLLQNSIVAANGDEIGGCGGTLLRYGNNIIGTEPFCYGADAPAGLPNINGDFVGTSVNPVNPLLSSLGNYGGPTRTLPPLAGSPAVDAGDNSTTNSISTDQRGAGFARRVGTRVDIGAVERVVLPPSLVTLPAVSISISNATLVATVLPNAADTLWRFQYGLTTNYTSTTAQGFVSGTNALTTVSNTITGLSPGTTYYFRISATNSAGGASGANLSFTTPTLPPTILTQPATSITANSMSLNATANPGGAPTSVYFQYGTTTNYGSTTSSNSVGSVATNVAVSVALGGLTPGALYHFRAVAVNSNATVFGGNQTAQILSCYAQPNLSPVRLPATLGDLKLAGPGIVNAIVMMPDGKIIIGGSFTAVNDIPRSGLARLNPNGSVDATWNPPLLFGSVYTVGLDGTNLYIGGFFFTGSGQNFLARLSTVTGALDANWTPSCDNAVWAIAQNSTSIFIGGEFNTVNGTPRSRLARVLKSGAGALDGTWNPSPNGQVFSLLIQNSNVFVGGFFSLVGGQSRRGVAKLSATGSGAADALWNPGIINGATAWYDRIATLASDGTNVYIGGGLQGIGTNANIRHLAKVNASGAGAVDYTWNPRPSDFVESIAIAGPHVYFGGVFKRINSMSPSAVRTSIARVSANSGVLDTNWNPNLTFGQGENWMYGLLITDSAVFIGGNFAMVDGTVSLGLTRIDPITGVRDSTFTPQVSAPATVNAMVEQPDGKVILGGDLWFANGLPRQNLLRVNRDGSLDSTWRPTVNGSVTEMVLDGTNLFVGGYFDTVCGVSNNLLAKLTTSSIDAVNVVDTNWNAQAGPPDPNEANRAIWVLHLAGNHIFVGGNFETMGGLPAPGVARLSTTGTGAAHPTWQQSLTLGGVLTGVHSMASYGSNLLIGGAFTSINGTTRKGLAKVSAGNTAVLDASWSPEVIRNTTDTYYPGEIKGMAIEGSNLYVGGFFTNIGGVTASGIARLSLNGSGLVDTNWTVAAGVDFGINGYFRTFALNGNYLYVSSDYVMTRYPTAGFGRDPNFVTPISGFSINSIVPKGNGHYIAGNFTEAISGYGHTSFALIPTPGAPALYQSSSTNLHIAANVNDGPEITHFMVVSIGNGTLFRNDGITPINCGEFISAEEARTGLKFNVGGTVSVAPAVNATFAGVSSVTDSYTMVANPTPVVAMSAMDYSAREGDGSVAVTVKKFGVGSAQVDYSTADITAKANVRYLPRAGRLTFNAAETTKTLFITIADDFTAQPDETFSFSLSAVNAQIVAPSRALVTLTDNDRPGSGASLLANQAASALPAANGVLAVNLDPTNALGQWRLVGQLDWRDGGAQVAGLVSGNYVLEFRPVNNFYQPDSITVPVDGGVAGTNQVTNQFTFYYVAKSDLDTGNLTAFIEPKDVATNSNASLRGQWRRVGETTWRDSGELVSGLNAGSYTVEYKPVSGRLTPLPQTVQIGGGNANYGYTATYLLAAVTPGAITPVVVPFETAVTNAPYAYNGQLQTGVGFSSGVVVKPRVVLTVAHALFDDISLTYVTSARWFFQRYLNRHEPVPQSPRGWYVFSGYAAQRGADNSPGISTPDSQSQDVAALYFLEPAGRGGYGGYLASEPAESDLLTENNKMLVGYPLDGVPEADRGKLFATPATNVTFTRLYTSVFATTNIQSFPGNSGGPMYVQNYDGIYYPAGIYLGGSGQTLVRGIDSDVVDLINRAETSGSGGGNSTGGGVIVMSPGVTAPPFGTGLLTVNLTPAAPQNVRPGWRVANTGADYFTNTPLTVALVGGGSYPIEFKPVPGFTTPANRSVQINFAQTTTIQADYVPLRPQLSISVISGLTINGVAGAKYQIDSTTNLQSPVVWSPLTTLVLSNNSVPLGNTTPPVTGMRFYRAALIP